MKYKILKYQKAITAILAVVTAVGFFVIVGWIFNLEILKSVLPRNATMKFNAALCFLLAGTALLLQITEEDKKRIFVSRLFTFMVLGISLLTISQDIFGYDLAMDQFFFQDRGTIGTPEIHPGRMAFSTTICFVMISLFTFTIRRNDKILKAVCQAMLHIVTLISFVAIVGYLYQIPSFYKLAFFKSMAIHTAASFFLLSIGCSLINPGLGLAGLFTGNQIGNKMARKLFSQITIAILLLGYVRIMASRSRVITAEFHVEIFVVSFLVILLFLFWKVAGQLNLTDLEKREIENSLFIVNALLNSTPDPMIIFDEDGKILLSNNQTEKIFGYRPEEIIGKKIAVLLPTRFTNTVQPTLEAFKYSLSVIQEGLKKSLFAVKKNEEEVPVEISFNSIKLPGRAWMSAAIRDVSVKKDAERQINQLASIIESSADAIISKNLDGTITSWNKGAEQILGYTFNEVIGKPISILFPPDLIEEEIFFMDRILKGQHLAQYETIRVRKDKRLINVSITLSPIQDNHGNIIAVSKILRDITKQKEAAAQLVISNARNRIFIQEAPNAIAMFDKEMRYMSASGKWMSDYALEGREIIGCSHYDIFPEIGEDWKLIHKECLNGKIDICDGARFERKDGSFQWITWDVRPWYLSPGEIGGLIIYTADITQQKYKDAQRERLASILQKSNTIAKIASWEVDTITEELICSKMMNDIFELQEGFVMDRSNSIKFYKEGESRDKILKVAADSIKFGAPYDIEVEIITGRGNNKWLRVIGEAEFEKEILKRRFGILQDITKSKNIENDLKLANQDLTSIFNSGYVSIIGTNIEGLITHFNKGAEILLQYAADEMIGIYTPVLFHVGDELKKRARELSALYNRNFYGFDILVELAKQGLHDSREWTYVRKDGSTFPVQLIVTAIKNDQDEVTGFLGIATDITERKKTEEKIRNYSTLESKSKEMEQFAYIASHDLREPLLTIKNYFEIFMEDYGQGMDQNARKYAQSIINATHRMDELIKGLLDYSRLSKIKKLQIVDTNIILQEVLVDLDLLIKTKHAKIIIADLPEIYAYPLELKLLFQNLITNAIKFTKKINTCEISIYYEKINNGWKFAVHDNGIGIEIKDREKIFDMFQRLHSKNEYEGTGIGLAHCKKIAELHNGTIWVDSTPGQSSTFYFTILTENLYDQEN